MITKPDCLDPHKWDWVRDRHLSHCIGATLPVDSQLSNGLSCLWNVTEATERSIDNEQEGLHRNGFDSKNRKAPRDAF